MSSKIYLLVFRNFLKSLEARLVFKKAFVFFHSGNWIPIQRTKSMRIQTLLLVPSPMDCSKIPALLCGSANSNSFITWMWSLFLHGAFSFYLQQFSYWICFFEHWKTGAYSIVHALLLYLGDSNAQRRIKDTLVRNQRGRVGCGQFYILDTAIKYPYFLISSIANESSSLKHHK